MSNWNCNYTYVVPPTQDYQEYGVYNETINTDSVPSPILYYVGPTYNILYTGVTSYEFNGTTFYNYNLYEIPVVSSSEYDSPSSDLPNNYVPSVSSDFHPLSTSVSYYNSFDNSSYVINNRYTDENVSFTENFPNFNENDAETNESTTCPSIQVEIHIDITNEDSDHFEPVIESLINTTALTTQSDANNAAEYDALRKDSADSETKFDDDCEEYSSICEERKLLDCSVAIEDDDYVKKREKLLLEECANLSHMTEKCTVFDWSIEVPDENIETGDAVKTKEDDRVEKREKLLYEECVNLSFMTEESTVTDWSIEVPDEDIETDGDVKRDDDDVKTEEDDDFNEANSFTKDDLDLIYSPADIKYFKEKLYLEALFGPSSSKESLPVVGVLPIIDEETETGSEDDASEWVTGDLEGSEENISVETGKNTKSNVTFDMHESFIRNHTTESTGDVFKGMKGNHANTTENGSKTVPIFNVSEDNPSNCQNCTIETDEKSFNDDKREFIKTKIMSLKKDSIMETFGNEAELFVENISKGVDKDYVINAASEENLKTKKIESWDSNYEAVLKSDEEVVKWNEQISNQTDKIEIKNATDHISLENGLHGECYSKTNGVKIVENDGQNISKKKNKNRKFNGFRKWCSSLFCCARKKT